MARIEFLCTSIIFLLHAFSSNLICVNQYLTFEMLPHERLLCVLSDSEEVFTLHWLTVMLSCMISRRGDFFLLSNRVNSCWVFKQRNESFFTEKFSSFIELFSGLSTWRPLVYALDFINDKFQWAFWTLPNDSNALICILWAHKVDRYLWHFTTNEAQNLLNKILLTSSDKFSNILYTFYISFRIDCQFFLKYTFHYRRICLW